MSDEQKQNDGAWLRESLLFCIEHEKPPTHTAVAVLDDLLAQPPLLKAKAAVLDARRATQRRFDEMGKCGLLNAADWQAELRLLVQAEIDAADALAVLEAPPVQHDPACGPYRGCTRDCAARRNATCPHGFVSSAVCTACANEKLGC